MKVIALPVLVAFGLLAAPVLAQKPVPAKVVPPGKVLEGKLNKALAHPALERASVGVLVRSLDRGGKTIYARNPDLALMPASNMKILTAAAALGVLGPEFVFHTKVARIDPQTLVLIGSGDPSLDDARLKDLAEAVKNDYKKFRGVNTVEKIVVDASRFDSQGLGEGWQWDDESFGFSAQSSGLNVNENVVKLVVTPGVSEGDPASVASDGFLKLTGAIQTVSGGEGGVRAERRRGLDEVLLSGRVKLGGAPVTLQTTVERPALYAAHRFVLALRAAGVEVADNVALVEEPAPAGAETIADTTSAPLAELCKRFLKNSDNLYGECLLKALGAEKSGLPGSSEGGAKAVKAFLASKKATLGGFAPSDGSGLSRLDEVTPRLLVETLTASVKTPGFAVALPIGGFDGTLRGRFVKTSAEGNVRAKTGTLLGVSALSGYLTTKAGEKLVFSILMNHFDRATGATAARQTQDAIVLALMDTPRANPTLEKAAPPKKPAPAPKKKRRR